jgi:Protein of unknown function (DUF2490)
MKQFIVTIVLIFNLLEVKAQNIYQQAYWLQLSARIKFSDKWSWQTEGDYRYFVRPTHEIWQNLNQTHVHLRMSPHWEAVAGFMYIRVWQKGLVVPEWRPFQDIQYYQIFNKGWQLTYRARIEERFIHHSAKSELIEGFGFKVRPRLRVQLNKTINEHWTARLSEEYWYQLGDGFNQNQIWLSAERQLKQGFAIELTYIKSTIKRTTSGYFDRDNLRFSLIKNFTRKSG